MQIEERMVGDVVLLDLKGKITLGEGDELLKDKVNSLVNQGHRKIVLNLAGVPYIDSAGLGEVVRTYTTVSRQGGSLKLLNLTKRITDLLSITNLLTVFETFDSENEAVGVFRHRPRSSPPPALDGAQHFIPCGGLRYRARRGPRALACLPPSPVAASGPVEQEPARLRRPALRTPAVRRAVGRQRRLGVRRLLRPLGRRLSRQRHHRSRERSSTPARRTGRSRRARFRC